MCLKWLFCYIPQSSPQIPDINKEKPCDTNKLVEMDILDVRRSTLYKRRTLGKDGGGEFGLVDMTNKNISGRPVVSRYKKNRSLSL